MPHTDHLQELARQVRNDTIALLEATPEPWLTWAPPGTSNHILWHAGHALWVVDALCVKTLTGKSELPSGWQETFGMNCRPPNQTKIWPAKTQVVSRLRDQHARVIELLRQAAKPDAGPSKWPATKVADMEARIIHGIHDEAKHSGEMYLLFKMCRAKSMQQTH
jgi:hypothetical protein